MAKALVVCPGNDEVVLIEYLDTPLGALLHACSRFHPPTALTCTRACATHPRCVLERDPAFDAESVDGHDATRIDVTAAPPAPDDDDDDAE